MPATVARVSAKTGVSTGATLTPTFASAPVKDNLLLLCVSNQKGSKGAPVIGTVPGFTLLGSGSLDGSTTSGSLWVYGKRAAGADSIGGVSVTSSGYDWYTSEWSGLDLDAPSLGGGTFPGTANTTAATSNTITLPDAWYWTFTAIGGRGVTALMSFAWSGGASSDQADFDSTTAGFLSTAAGIARDQGTIVQHAVTYNNTQVQPASIIGSVSFKVRDDPHGWGLTA